MKEYKHSFLFFVLSLLALSACAWVTWGTGQTIEPGVTETPGFPAKEQATAVLTTDVQDDVITDPVGDTQEPVIIMKDHTFVYAGPDIEYPISHELAAETIAPVLGRNHAGSWWAVPGPGDGPGPLGWVAGSDVDIRGNIDGVPVLPAPPLNLDLPIIGNTGPPAADGCIVSHPGPGDLGPVYVYSQPDFIAQEITAQLGVNRWVAVIGRDNDWYHIQDSAGGLGWVPVSHVAHNGQCRPDEGPGSVPLIKNTGAPPGEICLASRPGQFPPPDIRSGPGDDFLLIARLGNWAEVIHAENGWLQIDLGLNRFGWVNGNSVEMTGTCLD